MESEIFYWLLNMSISATISGTVILVLDKFRKIPRRFVGMLWIIPLLRMWIPVGISSRYSLMSLIADRLTYTVVVYDGFADVSMMNSIMAANSYFPVVYKFDLLEDILRIGFVVWLIIAAALLIAMTGIYVATKAELKDAKHLRDNIYISDKITSPAVYGIIREKIIMPKLYEENDLKFILMHEETHIRRKDNLKRLIAIVTACVHWFNPMAWIFLKSFLSCNELACDEAVLMKCGESEKKNYATVLVNCAESKSFYASAFGGAKVRVRVERILSYKKLSILSIAGFAILVFAVGYALLTNAV